MMWCDLFNLTPLILVRTRQIKILYHRTHTHPFHVVLWCDVKDQSVDQSAVSRLSQHSTMMKINVVVPRDHTELVSLAVVRTAGSRPAHRKVD